MTQAADNDSICDKPDGGLSNELIPSAPANSLIGNDSAHSTCESADDENSSIQSHGNITNQLIDVATPRVNPNFVDQGLVPAYASFVSINSYLNDQQLVQIAENELNGKNHLNYLTSIVVLILSISSSYFYLFYLHK